VIFVVNRVALGFAHFLQNHLLGVCAAIRPSTSVGFGPKISVPTSAAGFFFFAPSADLFFRVGHFLDHDMYREHIHLSVS